MEHRSSTRGAHNLFAARAKLGQHAWQVGRRLDVLGGVDSDRSLDLTIAMAQIDGVPDILVNFGIRYPWQALAIFEVNQLRIAADEGAGSDSCHP